MIIALVKSISDDVCETCMFRDADCADFYDTMEEIGEGNCCSDEGLNYQVITERF